MGRIRAVSSRRLVPGDVVVLQKCKATCDMVLLRGACLVEESMLSGEVPTGACTLFFGFQTTHTLQAEPVQRRLALLFRLGVLVYSAVSGNAMP